MICSVRLQATLRMRPKIPATSAGRISPYGLWVDTISWLSETNLLAFGDFYHISPIPSSASLAIPPIHKKTEHAKQALELLWGDGADLLNFFMELTIQKRIEDAWYADVME